MPRYEYKCTNCHSVIEKVLPPELRNEYWDCNDCGKLLTRRYSAPRVYAPTRKGQ